MAHNNFHGRTTTIISFSDDETARRGFGPYTPGFRAVPFGDADALAAAIDDNTVAVLLEPIQGEAGIIVPPDDFLPRVRALCTERNVLMIADEIQSGLARTGRTFACDHWGVVPDIYLLGKALGGGVVPLSAVVANRDVLGVLHPGEHGSTFGGNPLAAAIGIDGRGDAGARRIPVPLSRTRRHTCTHGCAHSSGRGVVAVRGMGLWAGVDIEPVARHRQADQPETGRTWCAGQGHARFDVAVRAATGDHGRGDRLGDWSVRRRSGRYGFTLVRYFNYSPTGGTMTAPSISLKDQLLRRRPVTGAPVAHGASDHLKRSIGAFQLTMFGVGATVGTGIFIVLQQAVPKAGPAVLISFVIAGIAAGLSAICYAEMASAVPVSGSTYSYAYTTMGEVVAMGVAACLLLEYGVSMSATAVGWSGYLNKLLDNLFGVQIPHSLTAAPFGETPGIVNLPAMLLIVMCALLLIRGASESAKVNTIMVLLKLGVLALFVAVAFTAFTTDHFAGFWDKGFAGITAGAATIFFTFIGLDAVSTAGDEVKDPQRTMPRAIIAALIAVTTIYILVAFAGLGTQEADAFGSEEQAEAGLSVILENVLGGSTWASTILAAGAVISIFSVTLVVMYGQTRILFAMGRDGLLPSMFAKVNPRSMTPVNNTIIVAVITGILAGFVPIDYLWDLVSIGTLVAFITVSIGVIILRRREPDLPRGFRVPGYPVTPILSIAACVWILYGLPPETWIWFGIWVAVVLSFYFLWSRRHSALIDGGDGLIPTAAPTGGRSTDAAEGSQ